MLKEHFQIYGGTDGDYSSMVWSTSKDDWTEADRDDGEHSTFYTRQEAIEMLKRAKAACGYLKYIRIVEYGYEEE